MNLSGLKLTVLQRNLRSEVEINAHNDRIYNVNYVMKVPTIQRASNADTEGKILIFVLPFSQLSINYLT